MVNEKRKKLPSKLKSHEPKRVHKQERIRQDKQKKRLEKKSKQRTKIENEEELNPHEQDDQGFYKVPTDLKLDMDDERILNEIGALNLGVNSSKTQSMVSNMINDLDKEIESKTKEYHDVGIFAHNLRIAK
jgi:hypothetical protein